MLDEIRKAIDCAIAYAKANSHQPEYVLIELMNCLSFIKIQLDLALMEAHKSSQ